MEKINWRMFVVILIASYFLAYLIIWLEFRKKDGLERIKEIEKRNLVLEKRFDSLATINKDLTKNINDIGSNITILKNRDEQFKKLYEQNENEIKKLKKSISDLSYIDTFSSDDIKKYFSNLPK